MIIRMLFGGSFNPIHQGHTQAVQHIQSVYPYPIASVHFIPCGYPVHRPAPCIATIDRITMLHLALANQPTWQLDLHEIQTDQPSYTINTLRKKRQLWGKHTSLVWLLSTETLFQLMHWKAWQALTEYAHIWVVPRSTHPIVNCPAPVKTWFFSQYAHDLTAFQTQPQGLTHYFSTAALPLISSTQLRTQIHIQQAQQADVPSPPYGLDAAVWRYICQNRLYLQGL